MTPQTTAERKQAARVTWLRLRQGLDHPTREEYSRQILENLAEWELYRKAGVVHCFMSIDRFNEVETDPILRRLEADGKTIVLPRVAVQGELEHLVWRRGDPLRISAMGIREPASGERVPPGSLDLILVPLVAADRKKTRLGYGKGFYDRFLAKTNGITAGLLFEITLSQDPLPAESHDRPLDYLITEKRIY